MKQTQYSIILLPPIPMLCFSALVVFLLTFPLKPDILTHFGPKIGEKRLQTSMESILYLVSNYFVVFMWPCVPECYLALFGDCPFLTLNFNDFQKISYYHIDQINYLSKEEKSKSKPLIVLDL